MTHFDRRARSRVRRARAELVADGSDGKLRRRALRLEWGTNAWNAMEVVVTVALGVAANSLALVAFGLDSLIEVFASTVVIVHLHDARPDLGDRRTHRALRLIATAFFILSAYLLVASTRSLATGSRPGQSPIGIAYLALTACVMFGLASRKHRVARDLGSEPLGREAAMTFLDGFLSVGILSALVVSATLDWWCADALAAGGVGLYAAYEGVASWRQGAPHSSSPEVTASE
jgi:divalent metal cation (Fe/Co/Zn/Cd) transporter